MTRLFPFVFVPLLLFSLLSLQWPLMFKPLVLKPPPQLTMIFDKEIVSISRPYPDDPKHDRSTTHDTFSARLYGGENITHVKWLHIQKTGTSFFSAVYSTFCPRVFIEHPELKSKASLSDRDTVKKYPVDEWCDVEFMNPKAPGWHLPMPKEGLGKEWVTLTMLRHPAERLFSAYRFNRHGSKIKNDNQTFENFIREPQIPNCQTKMISGYECYGEFRRVPRNLNSSVAVERIKSNSFFFGLTERWNESMCLFHRWYGGSVESFELINMRPTKTKQTDDFQMPKGYFDLDFELYEQALIIFQQRLVEAKCTLVPG